MGMPEFSFSKKWRAYVAPNFAGFVAEDILTPIVNSASGNIYAIIVGVDEMNVVFATPYTTRGVDLSNFIIDSKNIKKLREED